MQWFKQHFILTTLMVIAILLGVLVALSSQITVLAMRHYLSDYASDIAIERLNINWWRSELVIEGFSANDTQGRTIAVDELVIDWAMGPLFNNHIEINSLRLAGLTVDIETSNFAPLLVGPIPLVSDDTAQNNETASNSEEATPWSVSLTNLTLEDISVCVNDRVAMTDQLSLPLSDHVLLNHCLSLSEFSLSNEFQLDKSQSATYSGLINLENVLFKERDGERLVQLDSLTLDNVSLTNDLIKNERLFLSGIELLSNNNLDISDIGIDLNTLTVDSLSLSPNDAIISLEQAKLSNLVFYSRASDMAIREVAVLDDLSVGKVGINNADITVDNIELSKTKLLEILTDSERSHHMLVEQLQLESFAQSSGSTNLGQLDINGLDLALVMTSDGTDLAAWFPKTEESSKTLKVKDTDPSEQESATEVEVVPQKPSEDPPSQLLLAGITLGAESSIQITDTTLTNAITHVLKDINLSLDSMDIASDNATPTDINYSMNYEPVGTLSGEGSFILSDGLTELNMTGAVQKLDMVSLSDYASRFIGYRIDSGLLDIEYVATLKDRELDVEINTLLEKFELGALQDHEQHELNAELGIPLPLALNLLRDSDNNISLDLPVKGSIDDPQFSVASIVSTVAAKAIKNAVIYHYSPLGMLSLASGVLDLATALTFDPITFEVNSIVIDQAGKDKLAKVIEVMNKKPRITMLICAEATEADIVPEPTPPTADVNTDLSPVATEQAPKSTELSEALRNSLLAIAQQRQDAVIDYLVNEGTIARERLLGCNIKFAKKKDAKPRVGISI